MQTPPIGAPDLALTLPKGEPDNRPGFKETLEDSINRVNGLQFEAHQAMEDLAVGKSNNLHETMIAIQKAEISFKMMMQVRNKIMDAYHEVMRMQV
jgi:flagellar hook-basal body complex protein FliE